ncbi:AraC family transcriptional regulator [Allostreptomyces psammosilenae]|uniref:AraC-like DNA-binding protein n=1 Tax=Allostreptomyces psammosilenae TaxID=1892865 RepID=A0A852ZZ74_9ACTN|nr:AraC family transcriptional regulator [Allostreptomyces psammosilenae]NYI07449.1 AraC-like DNA-binding protein [Allostreptomyces psammosilenae]
MDVLSDAIAAMRTGRPHSSRTRQRAPWGVRFQPAAGAGFHVVLRGSCWLIPRESAPVPLGVGDVVFLAHGLGHGLADSPDTPLVPAAFRLDGASGGEDASGGDGASGGGGASGGEGGETGPDGVAATGGPDGAPVVETLCGAYLLDQSRPHPLVSELPEVIHLPARVGQHPSLRAAVDLLGAELEHPRPGVDAVVPALLDTLLLYILRAHFAERADRHETTGWAAALGDPAVSTALRAIHREPARQWTVEELGARAGLSRAAFARRFAALVGRPPLAYLTWWRMTTAARLLRESDAPLRSVAERTGYTSEFAFAKAFKREHGTAPGEYRRRRPWTAAEPAPVPAPIPAPIAAPVPAGIPAPAPGAANS